MSVVVQTRGTPERAAIRMLVDTRGRPFVLAFFRSEGIDEARVAAFYYGHPVYDVEFERVRKFLKERLTLS